MLDRGEKDARGSGQSEAPHYLYRISETDEPEETRLARAKLLIMLEIAGGRIRETIAGRNREQNRSRMIDEARRWFFELGDFEWWCEMAGYDPAEVRTKVRRVIEHGLPASVMQRQARRDGSERMGDDS